MSPSFHRHIITNFMKYYCLTSVYRNDSQNQYYCDERSYYASDSCVLVGVRTDRRLHVQNVKVGSLPSDSIIADSHQRWFLEMLKLYITQEKSKFVIADHSRFPLVLELVGRILGHEIIRYCGSDMIRAAYLINGWKKYFAVTYAWINEFSLAQKVICNNARSFKFHFRYRRAFMINSAIMPHDYRVKDIDFDVVFVGGLEKRKGVLEFLSELEFIKVPLKVACIGDGSLKDEVKEYISDSQHEIFLLGNVDKVNVYETLSKAGAFYLQSRGEGFPRAITEALCFDLIVFTNQVFLGTRPIEQFVLFDFVANRKRKRYYNSNYSIDAEQYLSQLYA